MKLEYKLIPMEKVVVFQVLHMDERFRRQDEEANHVYYGDIKVELGNTPEISQGEAIYLRGAWKETDYHVSVKVFESNASRDLWIARVHEALQDWAQNWEGFQPTVNREVNEKEHKVSLW